MSDEQAEFAAYFRARRDVVRRTAYLLCGDWHFAEDLAQLAFLRLASAWRKVRDHGALDAYVHTILIRTYVAENRRWFRRRERLTGDFGAASAGAVGLDTDHDVSERMAMVEALRRLPPRQRAVVVARYYADLDVSATADALRCSTGTVKSQTSRALRALKDHVTIDEEVPDAAPRST
ncbi:SigE family RNA polymerase sigma factor [Virgisporangium ochraceum]